ncbi:MAG: AMP-binding protein [Nostocales cyanobacterium 94392]|nr:AMP-binding protein [Nostocales cyanobacterium 94392]
MDISFGNLVELLRYRAVNQSKQQAFTFLVNGQEESDFTYQELDLKARAIAVTLKQITTSGDRVLLLYPPGLEFIAAFFGCLYAGVVAVPAYPPRQNKSLSRLQGMVIDAEATAALTNTTVFANIQGQLTNFPNLTNLQSLHWLATDNINSDLAHSWQPSQVDSDSLAFLQYTSGSTGMPKGVMVSHGNLLANLAAIHRCFGHSSHSQGVIWLPSYHDMGLIGGILQPLYGGFPVALMSPVDFLQKPFQWLAAISRYKATTSGGPNFAYDLCVRKITPEQRETLDLSSWEVAFNGAEPIDYKSDFRNLLVDLDALKQEIEDKKQENEIIKLSPELEKIQVKLRHIVASLLRIDFAEVDIHQSLMAMGADSLVLAEAAEAVENCFSINLELRQLFEELTTLEALANYINQNQSLKSNLREINRSGRKVHKVEEELKIPLSEAQKQLWILAKMGDDGSLAYNLSATAELKGEFQLHAMRQAVQSLVNRHDALRTSISNEGDFQSILPNLEIEVPVINLSYLNQEDCQYQLGKWFHKESLAAFDLNQAPLFRFHILKLTEKHHLLVFTAHHIIVDGWSMGIILQELATLYSAECQNFDTRLKPPMQFREYIKWQEQQISTPEMQVHESYWLEKFPDENSILDLPTDRPRPARKTYKGNRQTIQLDTNLFSDIKQFSKDNNCTLLMTLLSVYTTLLYRLTGQENIVVGVPVAGRFKGSESLVGYCSHLLAIRSYIDGDLNFSQHLQATKTELLNAYTHQDYPFARLIEKLKVFRNEKISPLVTAIFNLNRPLAVPKMFGVETSLLPQPLSFVDHEICLNVSEIDGELVFDFDYNTDLFNDSTIHRFLELFQTLLRETIANSQKSLASLPLLNQSQRHQLLVEWNDTQTEYPQNKCIHELFEEQVAKTPNAIAVVFENQQLTYQELNNRANQLAHHLQKLGVKPEVLVGICLNRSLEMMIGLLAIIKAGGAYVPLDPTYPQQRLDYMMSDSGISILLTTENLLTQLPTHELKVICIDTQKDEISHHSTNNILSNVQANNLGYVIYTSGSTGKPKGVLVTHRNLVNHSSAIAKKFHLTSSDKVLQFAALSFDVAIEEIFPSWLSGATVVLILN